MPSQTRKAARTSKKYKCCPATYRHIHKWYDKMFETLGWMVLAHAHGHHDKVNTYKHSLQRLKQAIEMKIEQIHEVDRIDDLKILHANLLILIQHVHGDF